MRAEKFDVLILGQEVGALWLIPRLAACGMRVGWISFDTSYRKPIPIDEYIAAQFGISISASWPLEFVTPDEHFLWTKTNLIRRFPGIETTKSRDLFQMLEKYPELLGLCQGIWKRLGRVESLRPETYLNAIFIGELAWWDPAEDVPPSVSDWRLPSIKSIDAIRFLERGEFQVVTSQAVWDAKHLVLGLDAFELADLHPEIRMTLGTSASAFQKVNVPVMLRFQADFVPCALKPVLIVFEETAIPDPNTEIAVFDAAPSDGLLTLWIQTQWPILPNRLQERTEHAIKMLSHHLPLLKRGLVETKMLGPSIPYFGHARVHGHRTRHKRLSWIAPNQNCHRIFPAGSLEVARDLLCHLAPVKLSRTADVPTKVSD